MHSERLNFVKVALSSIKDMVGPLGAPAIPIVACASASIFLIVHVETLQSNKQDLEVLTFDAAMIAYQYIRAFQENGEPQKENALYLCINRIKGTIDLIVDFVKKQKEKEDLLKANSALERAKGWIGKVYHAEDDKSTIAELRNQLRRDSDLNFHHCDVRTTRSGSPIFHYSLVTQMKSGDSNTPAITMGMPVTRPGRNPGDLVPYFHWFKMVIMEQWSAQILRNAGSAAVLDIACGNGGDAFRWKAVGIKSYVGLDSGKKQIARAERHLDTINTSSDAFRAAFSIVDCFDSPLSEAQFPLGLKYFDIVSIQVSMHIVWKTKKRAKRTVKNVGKSLRKGGIFIGTMFDDDRARAMIGELPTGRNSFRNTAYKVTYPKQGIKNFGQQYVFSLFGTAENRQRYAVPWKTFVKIAGCYGLRLKEVKSFKKVFEERHSTPDHRKALQEMNLIDANNKLYMDIDQWEVANFYIAFVFIKDY